MPASQGRAAAETEGRGARRTRGSREVGVLDSADYKGLTAGYYVVFSGVKDTQSAAAGRTSPQAKSAGYSGAYVRQIVPK